MADWEKEDYKDDHGHGTHIAGIILKDTCPQVTLTSCKYMVNEKDLNQNFANSLNCFKKAITRHFDIINYSSGGNFFSQDEEDVLNQIHDTKIVVAAGNLNQDLHVHPYYPASYHISTIIPVGNLDGMMKNKSSNYGLQHMVWERGTNILGYLPGGRYGYMTGTSQATARHTNLLLKEMCNDSTTTTK